MSQQIHPQHSSHILADAPGLRGCRARIRATVPVIFLVCLAAVAGLHGQAALPSVPDKPAPAADRPALADVQRLFYNARYTDAAVLALALRASGQEDLAGVELRTSALLFQLKGLLEDRPEKEEEALKTCVKCPGLIAEFLADVRLGQRLANAQLKARPGDDEALFLLGKIDLNYVWLQLGPLRKKTGWDEYWEARHSLDAVIKRNPQHVRALVARAWIDYIVDTRMPWGTKWLLGGGNRKRGLQVVREATRMPADFYTHAEAEFALWNMQIRERDMGAATAMARTLALEFPDNREVVAFLENRETRSVK